MAKTSAKTPRFHHVNDPLRRKTDQCEWWLNYLICEGEISYEESTTRLSIDALRK